MPNSYKPLKSTISSYRDNFEEDSFELNKSFNLSDSMLDMQLARFQNLVDTSSGGVKGGKGVKTGGAAIATDKLGNFIEVSSGRRLHLKGINLDAAAKLPTFPSKMTSYRSFKDGLFWDGDHVSFVGRPFPLEEADVHFNRIKSLGYNTIRYIITWEAIEHFGPSQYDDEFIDYTFKMLKKIEEIGGLYVLIDPHQDVWSRYTGGSGAPLWTLYAAGLNPHRFATTEAAFIHNAYPDPANFPKMVWPTNYNRLATFTMFTMFFSGKQFFPKCVINGVNIQDFLQSHFLDSFAHFMHRLQDEHPELLNSTVIGIETMNEPSCGLYGREDLSTLPKEQQLRVHTTPTPFQAMKLGMGIPCEVDTYEIRITGPTKTGRELINSQRDCCWAQDKKWDDHYNFKRDDAWTIGKCVYALHGIWDIDSETLMIPDYFCKDPQTNENLDINVFVNTNFVSFYSSFKAKMREVDKEMFLFMQAPVFELPPNLINSDLIDNRTVSVQHYYDGMSLMFKTWNTKYNVDTLGILRGRYLNPIFGMVFGENNIRKCIRGQFYELKQEKNEHLGRRIPMFITETGMPFDMDNKAAYEEGGDYHSQISALDCISYALESNSLSHTYWSYCSINSHKWGDRWNNEDFSFWSPDDCEEQDDEDDVVKSNVHTKHDYSTRNMNGNTLVETIRASKSQNSLLNNNNTSDSDANTIIATTTLQSPDEYKTHAASALAPLSDGIRAMDAIIRPYPVLINGVVQECIFDLKKKTFQLQVSTKTSAPRTKPSIIYFPSYHFPIDNCDIKVSAGTITYKYNTILQIMEWDHEVNIGDIEMKVTLRDALESENNSFRSLKDYACGFFNCCSIQ